MFSFKVLSNDKEARTGELVTPHGSIKTPSFVAVGTRATVKALSSKDIHASGCRVIIANSYHLHLQPGGDIIEHMGGLHSFMGWEGPLITDSGGFQIFSLGAAKEHRVGKVAPIFPEDQDLGRHFHSKKGKSLVRVDDNGVEFVSYLDGSRHRFSPEQVIRLEQKLGADIVLVLDECTSPLHDYHYTNAAMERTNRWAVRAREEFGKISHNKQALMGIVQGGAYRDLREKSAIFISNLDFDGYAIGGSLGRSKEEMYRVLEWTIPILPPEKPRHLLGIGEVQDIFEVVKRGIDLVDCVIPNKFAQTGTFFSKNKERFRIHIQNSRFKNDPRPVEEGCGCHTCRHYSRAYLRHLFMAGEPLAMHLAAVHNFNFMESLMGQIRTAIKEKTLAELTRKWNSRGGSNRK